jgi:flagellar motor switch protein FliG
MDDNDLTGSQKAAVFLMAMGERRSNRLKLEMEKDEVEELRDAMESLGKVKSATVEKVIGEYGNKRSTLPMNQPQNAAIREQQELTKKRPAVSRKKSRKPARTRAESTAEAEAEGNGLSPAREHLTNIKI